MAKNVVEMGVRPLSPWCVAVALQDTDVVVRPHTERVQIDRQVEQIAKALRSELGQHAPKRMLQESAESYYKVFCALSVSQDQPIKTKPCKG